MTLIEEKGGREGPRAQGFYQHKVTAVSETCLSYVVAPRQELFAAQLALVDSLVATQ